MTGSTSELSDPGHYADHEVEIDAVARLHSCFHRFRPDSCDTQLAVRFVSEEVVEVVRELAVDADWLHLVKNGLASAT